MKTQQFPASTISIPLTYQRAQLLPFQIEVCGYWHKIDNRSTMTKKRFLARLRSAMQFEHDSEYKRFYQIAVDTDFKSVMRDNLRVTVNF